jgi:transcriptional regulator with XRE-family HTH domain
VQRIALNLRRLRNARALTQADVAKKAGLSREYLSRIEGGRQDPTVGTLEKIAKALKVTVVDLVK